MTFNELREAAVEAKKLSDGVMQLTLPKGFKRPPKFPRGELLCENSQEQVVWRFDAHRVLKWLDWAEAQP